MTEVLILNNSARELVFNKRNRNQRIFDDILNNTSENKDMSFEILYGINISTSRIAIVGLPIESDISTLNEDISSIYMELDILLGNNNQTIFEIRGSMITILYQCNAPRQAEIIAEKIQKTIENKFQISLKFGIGTIGNNKSQLQQSVHQAKKPYNGIRL